MNLKTLADYCIGTAEAESGAGYIDSVFYDSGAIEEVLDMIPGSPKLLVGNKGTGKTVLFKKLELFFHENSIHAIYLTPRNILEEEPASETPAVLQSFFYKSLVKAVAIDLAKDLNGLLSEDERKLAQVAISSGDRDPFFITKAIPFLKSVGTIITQRDFSSIPEPDYTNVSIRRISEIIGRNLSGKRIFFLIIDEPDDVSLNGQGGGRIWALLHACRDFCQNIPNVRCLISLRTEIWNLLKEDPSGRKNIDQFYPLITSLAPSDATIKKIILKRLESAALATGTNLTNSNPYGFFFEGNATTLPPPATIETSTWEDYLTKQSRGRPRDSIQLIRELALQAKANGKTKITEQEVRQCATSFSETRLTSLCAEYANDFPNAQRILSAFSNMKFVLSTQELKYFLIKRVSEFRPVIRGKKTFQPPDGVFYLWRILHEMGFINPRIPDASQTLGYRHILYDEDPNFVAQNNLNNMQKVCWEIHPAYRSYLYSLCDNEIHRRMMIEEAKIDPAFSRRQRISKRH